MLTNSEDTKFFTDEDIRKIDLGVSKKNPPIAIPFQENIPGFNGNLRLEDYSLNKKEPEIVSEDDEDGSSDRT